MKLFGFEITRKQEQKYENQNLTFATPTNDEGAVIISGTGYGNYLDLEGTVRTEAELVTRYREMALFPEVDAAVDEIVNESICVGEDNDVVKIILDDIDQVSESVKTIIEDEFGEVLKMLKFSKEGHNLFRKWYVDGRLYFHAAADPKRTDDGIIELMYIDPRKIRLVREVTMKRIQNQGEAVGGQGVESTAVTKIVNEYYIYNEKGFNTAGVGAVGGLAATATSGIRIAKDSIIHIVSGATDSAGSVVLSYLHKAIKPLNQLKTLEDATVIYRLVRAPERRVWKVEVGNLPRIKAEQYVKDQMTLHKNRVVYDAATGIVRDDRKFLCYALDTKIPLLDGRTLSLQQLINEYEDGKLNWAYSCNPITGAFVPGPISWAGITKQDSPVVRITFDNGKSVVCTPDHKFPVWNKGFIEAQHLTNGESIIPGYRRKKTIGKGGREYDQIFDNEKQEWIFTHRSIASWKDSFGLREEMFHVVDEKKKTTVHHKNFNRLDNTPSNLVMMGNKDHYLYHVQNSTKLNNIRWNTEEGLIRRENIGLSHRIEITPEILSLIQDCAKNDLTREETCQIINKNKDKWISSNKKMRKFSYVSEEFITFTHRDILRICKDNNCRGWRQYKNLFIPILGKYKSYDEAIAATGKSKKYLMRAHAWKKENPKSAKFGSEEWKNNIAKYWKITQPDGQIDIVRNLKKFCRDNDLSDGNIVGKSGHRGFKAEKHINHKVLSVEWLDEKQTVGSITIDQNETYHSHHTYLLDAGVYTKNTMLEDYWLPVRDGKGAEVDTLPSGELTGVLDDVLYFQKKLYNSLNVPVTRLNSEDIFSSGKATEITRAEIKFSRFIFKLRTKFCDLFLSLLEKQLILKNKITYDEWEAISGDIRFDFIKDNYFSEYKDIEVNTDRANLLMLIDPYVGKYYSAEWVRKFILKQSDEDIDDIDKEIKDEGDNPQVNPGVLTPQVGPDGQPMQGPLQQPQNLPPPAPGVNPGPGGSPAPPGGWQPSGKKASPKQPSASKKKSE